MTTVTLRQGIYTGTSDGNVKAYHAIPYAQPFTKRHQLPRPPVDSNEHFSATQLGSNCPQLPSRVAFVDVDWDPSTKYDELNCGVLSIYIPETIPSKPRPVIIWLHGGGFVSGGSQLRNYNGTELARDANAVVACINYRLGAFGFLHNDNRSLDKDPELPASVADVVAAFEWVHANIQAFGGDPSNITAMGQSAGAYLTQSLLSIRPDLLHKAIIQSSPAAIANLPSDTAKVLKDFNASLPPGALSEPPSTELILQAQGKATAANTHLLAPWAPTTSTIPGCAFNNNNKNNKEGHRMPSKDNSKKDILIGWTTDGLAFAHTVSQSSQTPAQELDDELTDKHFRRPSIALAGELRSRGHAVTAFELKWAPKGFESGPTHCIDLPLVFGFEAWSGSPMCTEDNRKEWEERGVRWRRSLGGFVWDGRAFETGDGVEVVSS